MLFDFQTEQWNNGSNMDWDKFSEKSVLRLLPLFLIIKSLHLIGRDLWSAVSKPNH